MKFLTPGMDLTTATPAADLAKIDRTIRKEPVYHSQPQYFLLLFGPEVKKRIWVVLDGEDFYVDRNGNGDLTETGNQGKFPGEVEVEGDGNTKVALRLSPPSWDGRLILNAYVQEQYLQCAGIKLADRPEDASVYHFQGPLRIELVGPNKLVRGHPNFLEVAVGTPPGEGNRNSDWVSVYFSESIPPSIKPRMEIEFPSKKPDESPIKADVALQRFQTAFNAIVRVPEEAGPGKAKVCLSFPDWKGFDVAPSVREIPLEEPGPEEARMAKERECQPLLLDEWKPVVDLTTIDRSVPMEPEYKSKPQYCLLLLGQEAKTHIWLVLDGDTLYVERNGRGDWIEADKQVMGRTILFTVQEIQELDGTKHNDLKVYAQASRIHPGRYRFDHISLVVKGQYLEYTCIGATDCNRSVESPQEAPVRHFNGPLRMELGNLFLPIYDDPPAELHAQITTKYPSGEWVFIDSRNCIPTDIHPVAEIEFPNRVLGGPPVKLKMSLTQRC